MTQDQPQWLSWRAQDRRKYKITVSHLIKCNYGRKLLLSIMKIGVGVKIGRLGLLGWTRARRGVCTRADRPFYPETGKRGLNVHVLSLRQVENVPATHARRVSQVRLLKAIQPSTLTQKESSHSAKPLPFVIPNIIMNIYCSNIINNCILHF